MVLSAIGKIVMMNTVCIKCNSTISIFSGDRSSTKCLSCGAFYSKKLPPLSISDHSEVTIDYEFIEYRCMHSYFSDACTNVCPAQSMFCEGHSDDRSINYAIQDVSYCEARLLEAKEKLSLINESKKTWLIANISGINEK